MITRWLDKNVTLDLIVDGAKTFFEREGFDILIEKSAGKTCILARKDDSKLTVRVEVYGQPNDFYVDFVRIGESAFMRHLSLFLTLVGAGHILAKSMRKDEAYQKVEEEFWSFMDQLVDKLAKNSPKAKS